MTHFAELRGLSERQLRHVLGLSSAVLLYGGYGPELGQGVAPDAIESRALAGLTRRLERALAALVHRLVEVAAEIVESVLTPSAPDADDAEPERAPPRSTSRRRRRSTTVRLRTRTDGGGGHHGRAHLPPVVASPA
jgi:hypothetical protein